MNVKMIWATPDIDAVIARIARVSNPANQLSTSIDKLLQFMMKHGHFSPFEMANACIEVNTTRDIGRQILRHRSFQFQEFCVAEGTMVTTVSNCGKTKKLPIETLYRYQFDNRMKAIWDRGIRVYDETTKTFVRAVIKEVFSAGAKDCFEVKLDDGKVLKCTAQHKLLSESGFARLETLEVGDFVATNGVETYKAKEWMSAAKARNLAPGLGVQGIANEARVSYHTIRKWLKVHGCQFSKKENSIIAGGAWNKGLPPQMQPNFGNVVSERTRRQMQFSSRKGASSNLYLGGRPAKFRMQVAQWQNKYKGFIHKRDGSKCALCGVAENLQIDHVIAVSVDRDKAFDLDNLQVLCAGCHREKTTVESVAARKTIRWKQIVSITPVGSLPTYDIEVNHASHNYVADGFVTHNSQRYSSVDQLPNAPLRECRMQDSMNRQSSTPTSDESLLVWWKQAQTCALETSTKLYQDALTLGIAKEQARAVLPEGLTPSRLYMNGNLRSWIFYLKQRLDPSTQYEHRVIAGAVLKVLRDYAPVTMGAFFGEQS